MEHEGVLPPRLQLLHLLGGELLAVPALRSPVQQHKERHTRQLNHDEPRDATGRRRSPSDVWGLRAHGCHLQVGRERGKGIGRRGEERTSRRQRS